MSDEPVIVDVTPALGPGDDDPRSAVSEIAPVITKPLRPGDDDPKSPARGALESTDGPAKPGDGGDERFRTLTPPAAGPGDTARRALTVTQIPIRPHPAEE